MASFWPFAQLYFGWLGVFNPGAGVQHMQDIDNMCVFIGLSLPLSFSIHITYILIIQ